MTQVYLAEDHPAIRCGLRQILLQAGIEVCGEGETLEAIQRGVQTSRPDLVLVDLSLGDEDGMELLYLLGNRYPGLPLLVYSMFEDVTHVRRALEAGAAGYLTKREPASLLPVAVRVCLAGVTYLSPRAEETRAAEMRESEGLGSLSPAERAVMEHLGHGLGTPAIAARMDVSPRTVETYYNRIILKLGLAGMKDLRQRAAAGKG